VTPERIGKYELRGTLGRGAMGVVFDGWDPAIGRRVAIKTVRLADAEADEEAAEGLARFRREAQAAGRLSHANIVGVFDTGDTDELAYIVMEFIEGRSLKQVLDAEKALPPARAADIMGQVLAGLEYSHKRGVVHRDIKPANVMMTEDGHVKLADFGIARIASSSATAVGVIMGTPAYMPPEQFLGEPADARSDIYAAGAMLFHLLTGSRPYEGNPTSIMTRVLQASAPPLPSQRSAGVGQAWDAVIARAMARLPEDRFQSAAAFAAAIRQAAAGGVAAAAAEDATLVVAPPRTSAAAAAAPRAEPAGDKRGIGPLVLGGGAVALAAVAGAAWLVFAPAAKPPVAPAHMVASAPPKPAVAAPALTPVSAPAAPPASPQTVRDALAAATSDVACSVTSTRLAGTAVSLLGIAGAGGPEQALRQAAQAGGLPVTVALQDFPALYCPAVDMLRPVLREQALEFTVPEAAGPVKSTDEMHPTIANMPFDGWIRVDYLSGDGTVFHVLPMPADKAARYVADPPRLLRAGAALRLGEAPHNILQPGPPYGRDMIVAITSTLRLFPGPEPQGETVARYAADMRAAIAAAKARGARMAAGVALISTKEK
jgi:serine/threonine-protein kinase